MSLPQQFTPHGEAFVPLTEDEIEELQPAVIKLLREAGTNYPCHDESEFLNQVDALFVMASASLSLPSPCGHPSQYAYSEDGGAHMVCLLCERAARLRAPSEKEPIKEGDARKRIVWGIAQIPLPEHPNTISGHPVIGVDLAEKVLSRVEEMSVASSAGAATFAVTPDLEQRVLDLTQECRDAARKLTEDGWDFKGGIVRDLCKLVEDELLPALRTPQSATGEIDSGDLEAHNRHAEHCDYCCVIAPADRSVAQK